MLFRFPVFIISFFLMACNSAEPDIAPLPPSDLTVEVTVNESNPDQVSVAAAAKNANYFTFSFGDGSDNIKQNNGTVSHTYAESGNYTIEVKAHTTADVFISDSENVKITVEDNSGVDDDGFVSPEEYEGYNLVWQDEFEGAELSSDYTFEIGTGSNGWGNNESQYYREENTRLQDGYLVIEAKKENFQGQEYTSSRIITENKREFKYGRFDIRAKLPSGQGIWPAIWMLGSNFRNVGWPQCGEIDIMEMIGGQGRENTVHGTVHWQNEEGYASYGKGTSLSSGTYSDQFYVYSIIWDESSITWLVNNEPYNTIDTTPAHLDEFREEFFFIFNVAVGGNWPGYPDETTEFPQEMWIDYIRVFQQP